MTPQLLCAVCVSVFLSGSQSKLDAQEWSPQVPGIALVSGIAIADQSNLMSCKKRLVRFMIPDMVEQKSFNLDNPGAGVGSVPGLAIVASNLFVGAWLIDTLQTCPPSCKINT